MVGTMFNQKGALLLKWIKLKGLIKLIKGKTLRKHSLHEKTAASVLLKMSISNYG